MSENNITLPLSRSRQLAYNLTDETVPEFVAVHKRIAALSKALGLRRDELNLVQIDLLTDIHSAGLYFREREKNNGERGQFMGRDNLSRPAPKTWEQLGVHPKQAQRWQIISYTPIDILEAWMQERATEGKLVTESGAVALGRTYMIEDDDEAVISESDNIEVICGDMLEVLPTLPKFDLVIADPPYNVTGWDWDKFESREAFNAYTRNWLVTIKAQLKETYNLFWFCSPQYIVPVELALIELELPIQSRIIWHRRNMAMGSDSAYKFIDSWEMIYHCGNRALNFPVKWDSSRFDVQTFAVPQTNFNDRKLHPTQKPLGLIQRLVEFGSYPGDIVIDPFAGSGTTGAACKEVGERRCILIEREASYVEVINERL